MIEKLHDEHQTRCLELKWGRSTGSITRGDTVIESYNADVDLWYCADCDVCFIHDWGGDRYIDLSDNTRKDLVDV